jgi:HNH endonuclease
MRYEIAEWWEGNFRTAYPEHQCAFYDGQKPPYHWKFVIDLGEPSCFACNWYDWRARTYDAEDGYTDLKRIWDDSRLERAHIVPYSLGGSNHVSNYLLLCKQCHKDAPDTANPRFMLQWAQRRDSYGTIVLAKFAEAARYLGVPTEQACQVYLDHTDRMCIRDVAHRCVPHFGAGISTASQLAALLAHAEGCGRGERDVWVK